MHKYLFIFNKVVLCGVVAALAPAFAHAQNWKPDKVVEIVIGTTPGGPQDRQGRVVQRVLQEHKLVDQTINVIYKPGGGGAVGAGISHAAQGRRPPDADRGAVSAEQPRGGTQQDHLHRFHAVGGARGGVRRDRGAVGFTDQGRT